ncbi:MAG: ComF family protein [Alphaproteobacteria bacterium]|nr:MAG: ComF family protein [Alphaproteobacteria bacterium]
MQSPLAVLYPAQCVVCATPISDDHGLCGKCWAEMPFINGQACEKCGAPMIAEDEEDHLLCDECMTTRRPWRAGRAALVYSGAARGMVLRIKLSDRLDLVPPAAQWMVRAGRDILHPGAVLVPIPAHWTRVVMRRYNQASELARAIARLTGLQVEPTALVRPRRTARQEPLGQTARFENLKGAIQPHPRRGAQLAGRRVVLVDDVLTSGATMASAAEACLAAGAADVSILTLARTVKGA